MLKKILAAKSFECFAFNLDHFTPRSKLHLKLHIKLFTQNAIFDFCQKTKEKPKRFLAIFITSFFLKYLCES